MDANIGLDVALGVSQTDHLGLFFWAGPPCTLLGMGFEEGDNVVLALAQEIDGALDPLGGGEMAETVHLGLTVRADEVVQSPCPFDS